MTTGGGGAIKALKPISSSFKGFTSFAKRTKGVFNGANHATLRGKAYKDMIRIHNNYVKNSQDAFNTFDKLSGRVGHIETIKDSFKD